MVTLSSVNNRPIERYFYGVLYAHVQVTFDNGLCSGEIGTLL